MDLARAGGIDLFVTKSISRFGRNIFIVIGAIQELRKIGIEITLKKKICRHYIQGLISC